MNVIAQAAQLACHDIYDPVTPEVFGKIYRIDETVCGTVMIGGQLYIANQGTETLPGWMADGEVESVNHPVLGELHAGFYRNIAALVVQLTVDVPAHVPIVVTGHSKGAAEAALLGACLKLAGMNVVQMILFACPRPGYRRLADWLRSMLPAVSFRNAPIDFPALGDPVPVVPLTPYFDPYPHALIDVAPGGLEDVDPFARHAAALYQRGATAWEIAH